jgi:uncharacterized protein (UPF0261 family)
MAGMAFSYHAHNSDNASSTSLQDSRSSAQPKRIAITMFGLTTPAVHSAMSRLATYTDQETGMPLYEPIVFHATGSGGRSMERLIDEGVRIFDLALRYPILTLYHGVIVVRWGFGYHNHGAGR